MATWNADKPAVGNQVSADIPDIEENFQELHDVITAITNGTLGTTTAANFQVDSVSTPAIWLERARFEYKDADEIYIHAGAYHHVGTVSQVVYWSSKLTSDIGTPSASDWYYLYIDDSAVVTLGTNLLTTDQLLWSNTEPSWSETKHGWYSGEDKCIFAVLTDGSGNITEFFHNGDNVWFADQVTVRANAVVATDWSDEITLSMPVFARRASVTFVWAYINAAIGLKWRTEGQTGTTGHFACLPIDADVTQIGSTKTVIASSNLKIDIAEASASNNTCYAYQNNWYFPTGV